MSATETPVSATRSLVTLYLIVGAWYLVAVAGMWVVGIESLYGHPTPFYAVILPSFSIGAVPAIAAGLWIVGIYSWAARGGMRRDTRLALSLLLGLCAGLAGFSMLRAATEGESLATVWLELRWHLLVLIVFACGFTAIARAWPRLDEEPPARQTIMLLTGMVVFSTVFALSVAMLREGVSGITQSYERFTYEYIGDIGKARSIPEFIGKYNELQPLLTMHSKVHPPGPVVILWLMSYVTGQDPLGLSIGTVVLGSLSIVPLYLLARDLAGGRAALVTACLFAVMPGFVLFNAVSTDATFLPFTVGTLWLFWRSIDRGSAWMAAAAGLGYASMTFISFSLVGVGIFFGLAGIWRLKDPVRRKYVFKTAAIMIFMLILAHGALWAATGYDVIENFRNAKAQFDEDQHQLDLVTPRFAGWTFRFWNPMCWFFYAGIPISVLCVLAIVRQAESGLAPPFLMVVLLTLFALNLLYLGRGEGERSAMYLYSFIVIPAGSMLARICLERRTYAPFLATGLLVAMQTWAVETVLYTYW